MANEDLAFMGIAEAARRLRDREITSVELTDATIARCEHLEPTINAYITPTLELARDAAQRADADFAAGIDRSPLQGIPVALKDLCATHDIRTTAGSRMLGDWLPQTDATVTRKLREGGAVLTGKLNLHEFAYGVTSANEHYGVVRNPWDLDRHPGGSSGGSGAAVAAGLAAGAIGTDTGGSIRIPAALCGVTGLMPSYGRVSRAGVVPLSWSLDHVGPLARSIEDAALFLNAIAGYDPADHSSIREATPFDATAQLDEPIEGLRIGIVRDQFIGVSDDVSRAVEDAIEVFRGLGAVTRDVSLPMLESVRALPILSVEAAAYHAEWLRNRPGDYSDEVRALLMMGATVSAVDYVNALRVRREFTDFVAHIMRNVDLLLMPTCSRTASRIDEIDASVLQFARLTSPWDHTGQPVVSVPCGFDSDGLPIGLSLAAAPLEEALLCRVAHAYQQETSWHLKRPSVERR